MHEEIFMRKSFWLSHSSHHQQQWNNLYKVQKDVKHEEEKSFSLKNYGAETTTTFVEK